MWKWLCGWWCCCCRRKKTPSTSPYVEPHLSEKTSLLQQSSPEKERLVDSQIILRSLNKRVFKKTEQSCCTTAFKITAAGAGFVCNTITYGMAGHDFGTLLAGQIPKEEDWAKQPLIWTITILSGAGDGGLASTVAREGAGYLLEDAPEAETIQWPCLTLSNGAKTGIAIATVVFSVPLVMVGVIEFESWGTEMQIAIGGLGLFVRFLMYSGALAFFRRNVLMPSPLDCTARKNLLGKIDTLLEDLRDQNEEDVDDLVGQLSKLTEPVKKLKILLGYRHDEVIKLPKIDVDHFESTRCRYVAKQIGHVIGGLASWFMFRFSEKAFTWIGNDGWELGLSILTLGATTALWSWSLGRVFEKEPDYFPVRNHSCFRRSAKAVAMAGMMAPTTMMSLYRKVVLDYPLWIQLAAGAPSLLGTFGLYIRALFESAENVSRFREEKGATESEKNKIYLFNLLEKLRDFVANLPQAAVEALVSELEQSKDPEMGEAKVYEIENQEGGKGYSEGRWSMVGISSKFS